MTSEPSAPHARKRVLLADASAQDCEGMKKALQSWGLDADIAGTGLEVLDFVRAHEYTLVYLNAALPVMSGLKTWEILRADTRFKDLPLIMAVPPGAARTDLPEEDFIAILEHPVTPTALLGELGRHFDPVSFESFTSVSPISQMHRETPRTVQQEVPPENHKESPPPQTDPLPEPSSGQNPLPRLPGFDCVSGLKRVMGNMNLYIRLLRDFQNVLLEVRTTIRILRGQNDIQGLEAAVHKIKGISGNLAADVLYKESVRLDEHLKTLDPTTDMLPDSQLDAFLLSIETTLNALSAMEPGTGTTSPVACPDEKASCDQRKIQKIEQLEEILKETSMLLRQSNTSARESFAQGIALFEGTHAAELAAITNLIDMFDFEGADEQLVTLASSVGIEIEVSDELQ